MVDIATMSTMFFHLPHFSQTFSAFLCVYLNHFLLIMTNFNDKSAWWDTSFWELTLLSLMRKLTASDWQRNEAKTSRCQHVPSYHYIPCLAQKTQWQIIWKIQFALIELKWNEKKCTNANGNECALERTSIAAVVHPNAIHNLSDFSSATFYIKWV